MIHQSHYLHASERRKADDKSESNANAVSWIYNAIILDTCDIDIRISFIMRTCESAEQCLNLNRTMATVAFLG